MTLQDWLNGAPSPSLPPAPPPPAHENTSPTRTSTRRRSPTQTPAADPSSSPWLDACLRLDATNPLFVASATAVSLVAATRVWNRYGRRIRNADSVRSEDLLARSKRLRGYVTSVGDADNFRFWHQPTLRPWAKPPSKKSDLKNETLHIRLAGVDAPELAHFGNPAQPYADEALDWLTRQLLGRKVRVELFRKDQYGRIVGMCYVRNFPWLRTSNVSELMLKAGYATVYEQANAVHAGRLAEFHRLEDAAKKARRGMWAHGDAAERETPAEFKRRMKKEGSSPEADKAAKEGRIREFVEITGASATDAQRLLKAASWRVNAALDVFFNEPRPASKASAANAAQVTKNLESLWSKYCDPSQPNEISMDGTMQYCADLGVDPSEVVMLALAWFTKAPTMGRFSKREWIEAWHAIGADSLERQKEQVDVLRKQLETPETFRKVYIFAFDYAKTEGQKSLQFEIAQELWNLLIPLDPASSFPPEHLAMWIEFLTDKGGRAVSKDSWNLFLDFTRTIDPAFKQYDEDAAWPSVIDDFVEYARARI
ncbi:hypothetical protein JCM3774_003693 [Rhodotorula dairenensis]